MEAGKQLRKQHRCRDRFLLLSATGIIFHQVSCYFVTKGKPISNEAPLHPKNKQSVASYLFNISYQVKLDFESILLAEFHNKDIRFRDKIRIPDKRQRQEPDFESPEHCWFFIFIT
jgi:hypothetical protein